jgi:ribosomal-protein-alanine N-acetyltransferase
MDLSDVMQIQERTPMPHWTWQEFLAAMQSPGVVALVAEIQDQVVAYVLYRVCRGPENATGPTRKLLELCLAWRSEVRPAQPLLMQLLNMAVDPSWRHQHVGTNLLESLNKQLRQPGDCIRVIVPETNLPLQLCLRGAGYRAIQVLHKHYGDEDAYLMERRR